MGEDKRFWVAYAFMWVAAIGAAIIALVLTVNGARAQAAICAPFEALRTALREKFHETETGAGLINDKMIITLFESKDGESWTLVLRDADDKSCVVFKGKYWSPVDSPVPLARGERGS